MLLLIVLKQPAIISLIFLSFVFSFINPKLVSATNHSSTIIPTEYVNVGVPYDIITAENGNLWYADNQNYRIVEANTSGEIIRTVGRQGTDEGEFNSNVISLTKDTSENIYVLDYCKISVLDKFGNFKRSWAICGGAEGFNLSEPRGIMYNSQNQLLYVSDTINDRLVKYNTQGNFQGTIGSTGTGNGELNDPWGITTDSSGNIYVAESENHRVSVFSTAGAFVRTIGSSTPGDSELIFPKDVEVLTNGDVIITSQNGRIIRKFDNNGTFILSWGGSGKAQDQFIAPQYLAEAADGSIWVTDWDQRRLQHFTNSGVFIEIITNSGATAGIFTNPTMIDFDNSGNMFVLDESWRVQKFDVNGNYVSTPIPAAEPGSYSKAISPITQNIYLGSEINVTVYTPEGVLINTLGNHGANGAAAANGDFNNARGMDFDSSGNVYVADLYNQRIQKFDPTHISDVDFDATHQGGFVTSWATDEFPNSLFVDSSNNVYVAPYETQDYENLVIKKYSSSGVFISDFMNNFGNAEAFQYWTLAGFTKDSSGNFYLTDGNSNRVIVYDNNNSFIETFGSTGVELDKLDGVRTIKINPITGEIVVVENKNHRIQTFSAGVKINNLISSADVINNGNSYSLVTTKVDPGAPEVSNISAKLFSNDFVVSDFNVNLTEDRDWAAVNAITLPQESKSLIVNLNPTDAPGVSATHSLYIVKQAGQDTVRVCTGAVLIAEVNDACVGYTLNVGDPTLSTETIDSIEYWKVTGLTGTGGIALNLIPDPTPTSTPSQNSDQSSANSTNNTSSSIPSSDICNGTAPSQPNLFQINSLDTSSKLFFSPLPETNTYYISFSTNSNAEEHGEQVTLTREGVQSHTVYLLIPNTTYYYKVRGQSGCMSGQWSNIMSAKTNHLGQIKSNIFYKTNLSNIVKPLKSITEATVAKLSTIIKPEIITEPTPATVSPTNNLETEPTSSITPTQKPTPIAKKSCFLWFCW